MNRNYNYRKHQKEKYKQKAIKHSKFGYVPTSDRVGHDELYVIDGRQDKAKKYHKGKSNKTIRQNNVEYNGKTNKHRKEYDFWWNWF